MDLYQRRNRCSFADCCNCGYLFVIMQMHSLGTGHFLLHVKNGETGDTMINEIMKKLDFPAEAIDCFNACLDKVNQNSMATSILKTAEDTMFKSEDNLAYYPYIEQVAEIIGENKHTVNMLFWLMCTIPLKDVYRENNLSDEMYYDTVSDLKFKLDECKKMHDVWGTHVTWFAPFFKLKRFAFGRLQYDVFAWDKGEYHGMKDGDLCFRMHVPSGSPLTVDAAYDSFRKLYNHYKDELKDGILPIILRTWFMYQPIMELLKDGSNLKKFCDLFDIVSSEEIGNKYGYMNFVFDMNYESEETLKNLPEDTSLRRSLKKYLLDGNYFGVGSGIILFDGEKIINK